MIAAERCYMIDLIYALAIQHLVVRPLQKSGQAYLFFVEQHISVVKEDVKEVSLRLYRTSRPHLRSTSHVNAELYGALLCLPLEAPLCVKPSIGRLRPHFGSSINCLLPKQAIYIG